MWSKRRSDRTNAGAQLMNIVMHWRRAAAALVVFALLAPGTGALAASAPAEPGVVRATLANGLRVVIVRNTLAPVVSTNVNYLVGADETPPGFPGTAHTQKHMMFRGSPGLTADQLADIGSVMGGNFNAAARQTVTQYFYAVPGGAVSLARHRSPSYPPGPYRFVNREFLGVHLLPHRSRCAVRAGCQYVERGGLNERGGPRKTLCMSAQGAPGITQIRG